MLPSFSLAAACCIPGHNPARRQKERKILTRPALRQLSKSWEATFPYASRLDAAAPKRPSMSQPA
jgi:hypothetical protein